MKKFNEILNFSSQVKLYRLQLHMSKSIVPLHLKRDNRDDSSSQLLAAFEAVVAVRQELQTDEFVKVAREMEMEPTETRQSQPLTSSTHNATTELALNLVDSVL